VRVYFWCKKGLPTENKNWLVDDSVVENESLKKKISSQASRRCHITVDVWAFLLNRWLHCKFLTCCISTLGRQSRANDGRATHTTSNSTKTIVAKTRKNGFVTATKLGTTNKFFVAATKNFAAATKRFVDRTKHFVVVTKYFCYPYFNKWFCWCNKTFSTV